MKAALITPFLSHLPLHPSSFLGYGSAVLGQEFELDTIDLNAHLISKTKDRLRGTLFEIDARKVVVDSFDLHHFHNYLLDILKKEIQSISWKEYDNVFITTPSWFVTVPTQEILKLSNLIKSESPGSDLIFFGNSLGSWTDEKRLTDHNIEIRHLNALLKVNSSNEPVNYDSLPTPVYEDRENYIFDILPFRLKHGCSWGKCRFCSLAKGWNSGYLERSAQKVAEEVEELINRYNPKMLVCRDNSINGENLLEFCTCFEKFRTPWIGMARADLSNKEIGALQKAGCRLIYFGLESGSDRVLGELNKGIGSKQMSNFIKELHNRGIFPAPSLFVGSPGETEADFEQTIQFIIDHKKYLDVINLYPLRMTPASEYTLSKEAPNKAATRRLAELIGVCEDTGIKVCVGEQSAEYVLFKQVYPGQVNY